MRTLGLLISGFLIGLVVACGGSSSADSGLDQSQVQQLITAAVQPLQTQLTTIQSELPHNLIVTKDTSAFGMRTMAVRMSEAPNAATAPSTFTATFLGSPSGNIFGMTQQVGISSTNYLFVSNADDSSQSAGLPVTILYEGVNCTGNAFTILAAGISAANVKQGIVFGTGQPGDNVAADYLMLKAGEATQPDFANSELEGTGNCVNITPGPNNYTAVYPLVQNDQTVSGVPSGPFSSTLGP